MRHGEGATLPRGSRAERKGFCGGYDLNVFGGGREHHPCQQEHPPWDPIEDYAYMKRNTEDFMSLWRCPKPTIAKVHGAAVAGGRDIALCCDLLVMADDARIGYMPTRVWGWAPPPPCGPTGSAPRAPSR